MIFDYHMHTKASPDGRGGMIEYAEKARQRGIDEIGFSDHILLKHADSRHNALVNSMADYVKEFLLLKRESTLPLKLGVEVDFFPDRVEEARSFIAKYPLDYAIGSVHFLGDWLVDDRSQIDEYLSRDPDAIYAEYFRLTIEMSETRVFDIVGHPDLVKIFGARPSKNFNDVYEETADAIAKAGMCAEINPKGLVRPCKEIYPGYAFLRVLHDHSVPITFGSDAHEPNDIGLNLGQAVKLARSAGYKEACTFERRKKEFVSI